MLGGGYIASELGQFFPRIGTPTTFIIRSGHLLTHEDDDIGDALTEYLRAEGIGIQTHAQIEMIERRGDRKGRALRRRRRAQREIEAAEIFYALGRVPTIAGLDLEAAGVEAHAVTGIAVDDTMRSSNPDVFAVGDVTGRVSCSCTSRFSKGKSRPAMRCSARKRRSTTVSRGAIRSSAIRKSRSSGASEKELRANGIPYLRASYPFDDLGKAIAIWKDEGLREDARRAR